MNSRKLTVKRVRAGLWRATCRNVVSFGKSKEDAKRLCVEQLERLERDYNQKWTGKLPEKCDICGKILNTGFVDGRTQMGPWANMCLTCHRQYGAGLGVGKGQHYDKDGVKIGG